MKITTILDDIRAFSERTGIKPGTVVRNATGQCRLYKRLPGHIERLERTEAEIRKWMDEYWEGKE